MLWNNCTVVWPSWTLDAHKRRCLRANDKFILSSLTMWLNLGVWPSTSEDREVQASIDLTTKCLQIFGTMRFRRESHSEHHEIGTFQDKSRKQSKSP